MNYIRFKIYTLLTRCYLIIFPAIITAQQSGKELFNDNWQFQKGDSTAVFSRDSEWREVDLPHDWSIEGPFDSKWASGTGFLPGGIGWYKKKFDIADLYAEREYAIYFDGVYKNSEVWINGHYLGKKTERIYLLSV